MNSPLRKCPARREARIPEFLADRGVDPLVSEDDEAPPRGDDEEQNAVPLFRLVHLQPGESSPGHTMDRPPEKRGDRNADLARGLVLGRDDRFLTRSASIVFISLRLLRTVMGSLLHHDPDAPPPPERPRRR